MNRTNLPGERQVLLFVISEMGNSVGTNTYFISLLLEEEALEGFLLAQGPLAKIGDS